MCQRIGYRFSNGYVEAVQGVCPGAIGGGFQVWSGIRYGGQHNKAVRNGWPFDDVNGADSFPSPLGGGFEQIGMGNCHCGCIFAGGNDDFEIANLRTAQFGKQTGSVRAEDNKLDLTYPCRLAEAADVFG